MASGMCEESGWFLHTTTLWASTVLLVRFDEIAETALCRNCHRPILRHTASARWWHCDPKQPNAAAGFVHCRAASFELTRGWNRSLSRLLRAEPDHRTRRELTLAELLRAAQLVGVSRQQLRVATRAQRLEMLDAALRQLASRSRRDVVGVRRHDAT